MIQLENEIHAYALKNALEHGKANVGKILPKLFQHGLQKDEISKIMPLVNQTCKKINDLSKPQQHSQYKEYEKYVPIKEEKPHVLPELKSTKNLIMRFEPSPSGPLHIGHAYVLALNSEYVKRYNGKLILRIGDTNPENIYTKAYDLIPKDANWLTGNKISKVLIQSSRLPLYYKYFQKLLDIEKAYICTCDPEEFKKLLSKSLPCPCRSLSQEKQKERWKLMLTKYKQGEAVARLKTDINHKNPAMRDFPLFRINTTSHPKQKKKYRVWPLMNMAVSIDDAETKVTHVIRAKDHVDNAKRQAIIHSYLGQKTPQALFVGKINFIGLPLSSTKTKEDIENKKYNGWDDIRLPTLLSLKRRGFTPESIIKYALDIGITLTDKTVPKDEFFKSIEAHNRKIIDSKSDRYSFLPDPIEIEIENAPKVKSVSVPIHPDRPEQRTIKVSKIYISSQDFKKFKGKEIRLIHLYNIELSRTKHEAEYSGESIKDTPKINWVSSHVPTKILMPSSDFTKGIAESSIKNLKYGDVVQFERFGFAKLDKKKGATYQFWFTHK